MLPNSPCFTRAGHESLEKECDKYSIQGVSLPDGKLTRWDGKVGTATELLQDTLKTVQNAVKDESSNWVKLGTTGDITREYHIEHTKEGNGNRFFRFKGILKVPPQLLVCSLIEPSVLGGIDKTVRHSRILYNFPDGRTRLMTIIAEAGPRPFFYDRDDCALTTYYPPTSTDPNWYQISNTCPSHYSSVSTGIRNHTMVWGYCFEPFSPTPGSNLIYTRATLISQTEIFGWLPKFMVNSIISPILCHYLRTLEEYIEELMKKGAPARNLCESYGIPCPPLGE